MKNKNKNNRKERAREEFVLAIVSQEEEEKEENCTKTSRLRFDILNPKPPLHRSSFFGMQRELCGGGGGYQSVYALYKCVT